MGLPAQRSGQIFKGDVLASVDNIPISSLTSEAIATLITGPIGSEVTLKFEPGMDSGKAQPYEVKIARGFAAKGHEDACAAVARLQEELATAQTRMKTLKDELIDAISSRDKMRMDLSGASNQKEEVERSKQSIEKYVNDLYDAIYNQPRASANASKTLNYKVSEALQKAIALHSELEDLRDQATVFKSKADEIKSELDNRELQHMNSFSVRSQAENERDMAVERRNLAERQLKDAQAEGQRYLEEAQKATAYAQDITVQNLDLRHNLSAALYAVQVIHTSVCGSQGAQLLGGLGIKVDEHPGEDDTVSGPITISEITDGGPMSQTGKVCVGDQIVTIDGQVASNMYIEDVRSMIVGPSGTRVTLTVKSQRTGTVQSFNLVRSGGIGTDPNTAASEVRKKMLEMRNKTCRAADQMTEDLARLKSDLDLASARLRQESDAVQRTQVASEREIQARLRAADDKFKMLQEDYDRQRREFEMRDAELKKMIMIKEQEQQKVRTDMQSREREIIDLNSRIQVLEDRIKDTARDADGKKTDVDRTRQEIKRLLGELDNELRTNSLLTQEIDNVRQQYDALMRKTSSSSKELQESQEEVERLRGDNNRLRREIDGHPREIAELRAQMDRHMAGAQQQRSFGGGDSDADKRRLEREVEKEREEKADLRREIAGLKSDLDRARSASSGGGGAERGLREELDRLKREVERAKSDSQRVSELNRALDAEKDKCRQLEMEMNKMVANEKNRLKDVEADLREKFKKLERELTEEQRRNEALTVDLGKAHVKLQDIFKDTETMRNDLALEKKNSINLVVEVESARNAKVSVQNDLRDAKNKIDSLSRDLEAMSQKHSSALERANALEREMLSHSQDRNSQGKDMVRLETELSMISKSEAEAKRTIESLTQELKRQAQTLKDVQEARAILEHDNSSTKRQLNEANHREGEKMEAITRLTSEITNLSRLFGDLKQQFDTVNTHADANRKEAETAFAEHTIMATEFSTILDAIRRVRDAACGTGRTDEVSPACVELEQVGSAFAIKKLLNGPAAIKLAVGDAVIKLDGRDVTNMTMAEVRTIIQGPVGTPLTITARRAATGVRYMATVVRPGVRMDEDVVRLMESQACEASRSSNAELAALRTELAHMKQHLKSEVDGSARSRDVLESQLTQVMNEAKQLKQDLEKTGTELANRNMDLEGMTKLLSVKDRELTAVKETDGHQSRELADLKSELANALMNVEKLCSDIDREMKKMALLTQDNNSLSDQLKEERARVKDLTKTLHQANGEIQNFKVQVDRAKQDASAAADHIADLEMRSQKLMEEGGEERGVSAKLRVEISQLNSELEKTTKRMVTLVAECGETKEEVRTLQAQITDLQGQLAEKDDLAAKDLNNVLNDLDTERKINERIRGEMNSLKNEAAVEREATVAAERNVARISKEMEELQSEMDRIVRRLDSTQESNNELRKALESEKEITKNLTTDSTAEHARGDALTVDLAKAHVALQDLHRQVDFMKSQLNSTKEAGTSVESMLNTEIDRLNTDLTSRNMENKEMSANIERLKSELENAQATNAHLQANNDKLTDQVSEERAKVSAGQREIAIATREIDRMSAEVKRLQTEMKDHPREKAEMRSAMDAALAERDAAIQARDSIRQLVAKLKAQIEMLLSDLDEQKNSNDALCDEISSLQAQLAEAHKQLLEAQEDAKMAWSKVVMLEDKIANMQEELDSLNVTRNALGRLELSTKDGLNSVFEMAKNFDIHRAKLMKELDRLETEIRSIHKNEMDAYDEIIDLKRQLDNNGGDLEKERRKLEGALQREAEQANTILALRTENDKLSRQLEKHKQLLADETARAESLKQQAEDAHDEHQKLAKEHARALEACRKMHDAVCRDNPCSDQGGVGIQIAEHESGEISIMTLYPGPARNCGKMASGDVVLSVDGKDVKGKSADDVRALVMGPPGTPVTVAAVRPGGLKYVVTLIRSGAGATDADDFIGNLEKETCDEAEAMHEELDRLRLLLPRIQALEKENEQLKKTLEQCEKDLADALAKIEPLKAENAKLTEKVKEQQKEIDELKALLAKLQQQVKELQKALDAEKRLTDQLRDQVIRKDAEIAAEKERTAAVKKELEETRAELERLRKEFAAEMERLRKEHAAEMDRLRKEHAEEIKRLQAENQKLRKEIEDLLARIRELEALLLKMRELEMLLAQEKLKNAELKQRLNELEQLIAQLEKDLLAARTAAEIAEARAEDLAQRLAAALADVQRLCNAVSKLETQIAGGLGLAIQRTEDSAKAQQHTAPVVVKGILESGPAGQSGQFEVGDTIVAVDNKPLRGLRIDEVWSPPPIFLFLICVLVRVGALVVAGEKTYTRTHQAHVKF